MTRELQRAMARYEEARIAYRKTVLASLNGASHGDAIRSAIQEFQAAKAALDQARQRAARAAGPATPARRRTLSSLALMQKLLGVG